MACCRPRSVPGRTSCPLREIWRQRQQLIQLQADEIRRMQKCLDAMNLRVHKVMSDLVGVTGRAIIEAILQGERDPAVLAQHRDCRLPLQRGRTAARVDGAL